MYVVRQIEENTKATRTSEKIISFHRIIDHSTLNRKLKNDLLKIFRSDLFEQFLSKRSQNHNINIKNARSINKSFYELLHEQLTEQTIQIDYLMKRELIRLNTSFWKTFILFAKKKDKEWKICINYRAFNVMIQKNNYSLSKIQDCLNMIETMKSFSKIDLINEYWQINVVEEDRHKIAFNIKRDKYEFCVMSFELINASIMF